MQNGNSKKCNVAKGKSPPKQQKIEKPLAEVEQVIDNQDLTDKQRLFCLYYIQENFNKTKAYMKAYGCNYETAKASGYRLFTNVYIRQEIDRLTKEALSDIGVSSKLLAKKIFEQYINIAFSDIKDYLQFGQEEVPIITKNGPLLDEEGEPITENISYVKLNDSFEVDGTLVTEVKQGKDGISLKLADKMKALEWLSEHVDLATEEQRLKIAKLNKELGENNKEPIKIEFIRASQRSEEDE